MITRSLLTSIPIRWDWSICAMTSLRYEMRVVVQCLFSASDRRTTVKAKVGGNDVFRNRQAMK